MNKYIQKCSYLSYYMLKVSKHQGPFYTEQSWLKEFKLQNM
jgi:hypothetical protein